MGGERTKIRGLAAEAGEEAVATESGSVGSIVVIRRSAHDDDD